MNPRKIKHKENRPDTRIHSVKVLDARPDNPGDRWSSWDRPHYHFIKLEVVLKSECKRLAVPVAQATLHHERETILRAWLKSLSPEERIHMLKMSLIDEMEGAVTA
jgi:hypothetical protein